MCARHNLRHLPCLLPGNPLRSAIEYALANKRKSLTFVHKGNIMKFTEGAFRNWGYALAEKEFPNQTYTWEQWERTKAPVTIEVLAINLLPYRTPGCAD